jgi:hypothetical protein
LNDAHVVIPHSLLLPLIKAAAALSQELSHTHQFAQTLIAYARNPDEDTANLLQDSLKSPIKRIQDAAAKAQAILGGVENAREFVIDQWQRGGLDSLSLPQKHYLAITIYDGEINNGGHLQYFVNSSGDMWKSAIKGLEDLGLKVQSKILKDATSHFGVNGPSENIAARRRQLERLSPKQKEAFFELDRRWFACEDHLSGLLTQFAIQHREVFSAQPGGPIE